VTDTERQSAEGNGSARPQGQEDVAGALRLRPERPRVTRLSRKVLAGASTVALVLISAAVLWALQNKQKRGPAPEELYTTDHHNVADRLGELPKDYAGLPRDVPRLGPPLPGDLGRPMVAAQTQSGPLAIDAEQQRVNQESEAARTSKVFASTNVRPLSATSQSNETSAATAQPSSDEAFAQNGQDRKLAFVNGAVDRRTTSPDRLTRPASPFVVQAGTVIPAALITGIRSDLPGQSLLWICRMGRQLCSFSSPTAWGVLVRC
jgi:type IV secretion system protein TrbI